ncbi:DNA topoisomerase [Agyrium rufum]|nr:DNA topoisomerase [Agyrium rufum]
MVQRILCVAEKPSIAKAVAQHLAGGAQINTRNVQGNPYVKNYEFNFDFGAQWGQCPVTMTSVIGHLTGLAFPAEYKSWTSCNPAQLFEAPVKDEVDKDKKSIADNITQQARYAKILFIWTDCDREGEYIGSEIRDVARKGNPRIEVRRARFSNTERAHVMRAALNPINLDERQVQAVAGRIEIDLRLGAAFTRLQTLELQKLKGALEEVMVSYGSCQFPTLGFIVDRYFRVQNFVPESFWSIKIKHKRENIDVDFLWHRVRLFDRMTVVILLERCLVARTATVSRVQKKPTSKWKPLPLTTVELQKLGSRFLRLDSQRVMKVAEELYTKGFISYPRTETDQFDKGIDLRALVGRHVQDPNWGPFAQGLMNGSFSQPRNGRNDDKAHPPIHPVNYVARTALSADEQRVYEFVTRRFLACCSEDAKGESTNVDIQYGSETFHAKGLLVLERNYLDVYPYDKWESSQQLPRFTQGETFEPTEAMINEGETTAPGYLTEPELISLMDANGIGTDATMAEHIAKIKERSYVTTRPRAGGGRSAAPMQEDAVRGGRGGRRGRGGNDSGRGGRTGASSGSGGGNGVLEFVPTTLGTALIEGYDNMNLEMSLGKPFLRKEMEVKMKEICNGTRTRRDFVVETLEQYREAYTRTAQQIEVLKAVSPIASHIPMDSSTDVECHRLAESIALLGREGLFA